MNLKQSKIFYLSLIIIFSGIIVTCIYYFLGGFEEVQLTKPGATTRVIAGKQFVSRYNDNSWIEFGQKCKTLLDEGDMRGTLTIITYHTDSLKEDQISKFVGITLEQEMAEIPQGFKVRKYSTQQRYQAHMNMHVLVQPRPQKVEAMIINTAQKDGQELEDFFFELRNPDNSLVVEGWVKSE